MPPARHDPTVREALRLVRDEPRTGRLEVSIGDRVGDDLLLAFLRMAGARFTGKAG